MESAFTICSNNYLAKAKVVADSFTLHHPKSQFYIILIDKLDSSLDYELLNNYNLIQISEVFPQVEDLAKSYNIIELSTAVKPAVFSYLFDEFKFEHITYLDPDLQIFDRFNEVEEALQSYNIILTPHFCTPIDDGKYPSDVDFLPFGIYNLGFAAIKNSPESHKFLRWWHDRLMKYCFIKPQYGMFTDQLWANYAPVFFEGCYILKHKGYNVANWNLYERSLTDEGGKLFVNKQFRLKFFHFSHYNFNEPESISRYQTRYNLVERGDINSLFNKYRHKLVENKQESFSVVPSYYQLSYDNTKLSVSANKLTIKKRIRYKLSYIINKVFED